MRRFVMTCGAVASLAACAPASIAGAGAGTRTVDGSFAVLDTVATDGTLLSVAVGAFESEGKVLVCAAAGARGDIHFAGEFPIALLRATTVYMGDETIARRLDFGATYPSDEKLLGKPAACARTDAPWRADFRSEAVEFRVGSVSLRT